jgi:hypothetical protein
MMRLGSSSDDSRYVPVFRNSISLLHLRLLHPRLLLLLLWRAPALEAASRASDWPYELAWRWVHVNAAAHSEDIISYNKSKKRVAISVPRLPFGGGRKIASP